MPKEVVHSAYDYSSDFPTQESVIEVRWGRDGEYCQLASLLVERADHSPVEKEVLGGWYISLDRKAINDLIRHLRRARDQAFGRDE